MTALKQARAQEKSQLPEARRYFAVLKAAVTSFFGAGSPQLAQFGLLPKKARKALTSSQLAVKAAKAQGDAGTARDDGQERRRPSKPER